MSKDSNPSVCALSNNLYWILGLVLLALSIFLPKSFNKDFVDTEIVYITCSGELPQDDELEIESVIGSKSDYIIKFRSDMKERIMKKINAANCIVTKEFKVGPDRNLYFIFSNVIKATVMLLLVLFIYSWMRLGVIKAAAILTAAGFSVLFAIVINSILKIEFSSESSLMIIAVALYCFISNISLSKIEQNKCPLRFSEVRYQVLLWSLLVFLVATMLSDISIIAIASGVLANELYFSRYMSMVEMNLSSLFSGS